MIETQLDTNRTIYRNLLKIKGLGRSRTQKLLKILGWNKNIKVKDIDRKNMEKLLIILAKIKKQTSNMSTTLIEDFEQSNTSSTDLFIRQLIKTNDDYKITYSTSNTFQIGGKGVMNMINTKNIVNTLHNFSLDVKHSPSKDNIIIKGEKKGKKERSKEIWLIEENLVEFKKKNILNLIETNAHRGRRFKYGYPVKGQRTRSNANTAHKLNRIK